jgi:hypothetical protein
MSVTALASGTQTTSVPSEHIVTTATVNGVYSFHVDLSNMQTGDTVELRIYQKIITGDSPLVAYYQLYYNAQSTDGQIAISVPIANELAEADALKFSIKQTAGSSRNYKWKVLKY